jgi:hypothetical protein
VTVKENLHFRKERTVFAWFVKTLQTAHKVLVVSVAIVKAVLQFANQVSVEFSEAKAAA